MKLKIALVLACVVAVVSIIYNVNQSNQNKTLLKENSEKELQLAAYNQIMN